MNLQHQTRTNLLKDVKQQISRMKNGSNTHDTATLTCIINEVGGINAVLNQCLSNEQYCNENISDDNLLTLSKLLTSSSNNAFTPSNNYNITTQNLSPIVAEQQSTEQHHIQALYSDIKRFYKTKINFITDVGNNLYLKYLPKSIGSFIYYNILVNKLVLKCVTIAAFAMIIGGLTTIIFGYASINNGIIYTGRVILMTGLLVYAILFLLLALSININLFWLIIQSFDFWFKFYNTVVFTISFCMTIIRVSGNLTPLRIIQIASSSVSFVLICLLDGINILSFKTKIIFNTAGTIFSFLGAVALYFNYDVNKCNWNPFESNQDSFGQYTSINFRDLCISGTFNMSMFMMKPVLSLLIRKLKKKIQNSCTCCCGYNNNNTSIGDHMNSKNSSINSQHDFNYNIQRSTALYIKPYFAWNDDSKLKHKKSNDINMKEIIIQGDLQSIPSMSPDKSQT